MSALMPSTTDSIRASVQGSVYQSQYLDIKQLFFFVNCYQFKKNATKQCSFFLFVCFLPFDVEKYSTTVQYSTFEVVVKVFGDLPLAQAAL